MYRIQDSIYNDNIYSPSTTHTLKIVVDGIEITPTIRNLEYIAEAITTSEFTFGHCITKQIKVQIDKTIVDNMASYNEWYFEDNVSIVADDTTYNYTIPIGYFYSSSDNINTTNDYYVEFTLYDKMYFLTETPTESEYISGNNHTRLEVLQDICSKYGLYLITTSFFGYDKIVDTYNDDLTIQDWLRMISERACGFARIGREKYNDNGTLKLTLEIVGFNETNSITIPESNVGNIKIGETYTISKIADSGLTYTGDDTGITVMLSSDNIFEMSDDIRVSIYNHIVGFNFQNMECKCWGDSNIDVGDIIEMGDYKTIAQMNSWTWGNGFYGNYKTNVTTSDGTIEVTKKSATTSKKYLNKKIIELEESYESVVEKVDENTTNITSIKQTTDQISTTVSNNYIAINNKLDNYATTENLEQIASTVETLQTSTDYAINVINETLENGVSKVTTTKGFTFDDNGFTIEETNSPTKLVADTNAIVVTDKSGSTDDELLFAGYDEALEKAIVRVANIWAKQYFSIGNIHSEGDWRMEIVEDETYGTGLGFFYMGDDN